MRSTKSVNNTKYSIEVCGTDKDGKAIHYPKGYHPKWIVPDEIFKSFARIVYYEMLQQHRKK